MLARALDQNIKAVRIGQHFNVALATGIAAASPPSGSGGGLLLFSAYPARREVADLVQHPFKWRLGR
ncbi:hypothetical protein AAFX91_27365 [Bradyrhizobium sp. 31Argb]|uniref:hypothetical protein n=1 Tax=Bradyrhizobium sp. 31Argb TaxID=3141247 RepID=UPI00374995DB